MDVRAAEKERKKERPIANGSAKFGPGLLLHIADSSDEASEHLQERSRGSLKGLGVETCSGQERFL
jgi:hypothetical protein